MEIKPEDIKDAILEDDDLGFELRVGRVLAEILTQQLAADRETSFKLLGHGGTYKDLVSGKSRQFDYRYEISWHQPGYSWGGRALLAIECKNLHESSPLVICGRARSNEEAYYAFIESICDDAKNKTNSLFQRKSSAGQEPYPAQGFVGKHIVRLKREKEKAGRLIPDSKEKLDFYERWSQALASCGDLVAQAYASAHMDCRRIRSLILPIVVVPDGSLWTVKYNGTGSIEQDPIQVDQCEYFVDHKIGPFTLTHIHFVTVSGLPKVLSLFWGYAEPWLWLFPSHAAPLV